jgi:hypothetical protein
MQEAARRPSGAAAGECSSTGAEGNKSRGDACSTCTRQDVLKHNTESPAFPSRSSRT